jgi:hypothetical protein
MDAKPEMIVRGTPSPHSPEPVKKSTSSEDDYKDFEDDFEPYETSNEENETDRSHTIQVEQ